MQEVVVRGFSGFVTSDFALHSLTAATWIVSSVVGGLSKLAIAKVLDLWGRPQGMAIMLLIWVLGFVMMAACKNVTTFAAAQVFSTVGSQGVSYCLTVFISDTTRLRNRGLMLAYATSPYIITTWLGGPINEAYLEGAGWRWGFGTWAIVTPFVVGPLIAIFALNQHKAEKAGIIEKRKPQFSLQVLKQLVIDFDLFGLLLLAGGLGLLLVPLSIYSYQAKGWESPMIICMLVFGVVLLGLFAAYEAWFAPVNFIPLHLLGDRTVFMAGLMMFFVFFNSACWGTYFYSMLLAVWDMSVTNATYISNIYRVGSCLASIFIGYLIRMTGRFKWVATYYAVPLMILGVGLMMHFREANQSIGYVAMTQIFVAFAGGPIVIAAEMAMMAPLGHQHIAAILAILDLFGSVGYAVGAAVSGAIWTGTFRDALVKYLPADAPVDYIYSSLYVQIEYAVGSPIRNGIALAYGESQRYMLAGGVAAMGLAWACCWCWRDIKVNTKEMDEQTKGNVV